MNFKTTILSAIIFTMAMAAAVHTTTGEASARILLQQCNCGNLKCSGCLLGKLRPRKTPAPARTPAPIVKAACECAACQAKALPQAVGVQLVQPQVVGAQRVISDVLVSQEMLPAVSTAAPCGGCNKPECGCRVRRRQRVRRPLITPPAEDCDFCELKTEQVKEKIKCQKVEQKEICIPPVRLPWQKCCPPTKAKVRVVNVLKSDSYECPTTKYSWKVHEPAVPQIGTAKTTPTASSSEAAPVNEVDATPQAPKMNSSKLADPAKVDLETVPRPPLEKK